MGSGGKILAENMSEAAKVKLTTPKYYRPQVDPSIVGKPAPEGAKENIEKPTVSPLRQSEIDHRTQKLKEEAPLWNDPTWVKAKNLEDAARIKSAKEADEAAKAERAAKEKLLPKKRLASKNQQDTAARNTLLGGVGERSPFQRKTLLGQ